MLWQYRTILFEFTKDGLLGDRYVDDEEMEKTLNQLGGQHWELVNVTLLQDGVLAFLKRALEAEEASPQLNKAEPAAAPPPVQPPRPALTPRPSALVPEPEEEQEEEERNPVLPPERPRRTPPLKDALDLIGGIKIS